MTDQPHQRFTAYDIQHEQSAAHQQERKQTWDNKEKSKFRASNLSHLVHEQMVAEGALPKQQSEVSTDTRFQRKSTTQMFPEKKKDEIEGVQQRIYLKWVQSQIQNMDSCMELPMTIMLLISFSMLALLHLSQQKVFAVEQAIEQDIVENANFAWSHAFGHKTIWDVHSHADFWSWVRLGLLPLVIQSEWYYSEAFSTDLAVLDNAGNVTPTTRWRFGNYGDHRPIPVTGDYLHYNRIIGGLRFRQDVSKEGEEFCRFPSSAQRELWHQWWGKPCYLPASELAQIPDSPTATEYYKAEREEWMFTDLESLDEMIQHSIDMEDGCLQLEAKNRPGGCLCNWCKEQSPVMHWLTERTSRVEISMATYNAEYGLMSLTGINFWFNRGSYIHKRVEVKSSWIDPWALPWEELVPLICFDGVWASMLLYIIIGEMRQVVHVIRNGEGRWYKSLQEDYVDFWNVVDWVSIGVACAVVGFFLKLSTSTQDMHKEFQALISAGTPGSTNYVGPAQYNKLVHSFYSSVEEVCEDEKSFRFSLCIYPMMVMLRLFKSFAAQERLAVVTATLVEAANDLFHFFIVFLSVFSCMTLMSVQMFGQDLEEFLTFPRALHTSFRMMFGDWDWEAMEKINPVYAAGWFVAFMLVNYLILLNMLVAIMIDNYMKVKKKAEDAITVQKQLQEMWRRRQMYKRHERVRLEDIWEAFLKVEGTETKMLNNTTQMVNAEFLLNLVEGIPMSQASRTIKNSKTEHMKENSEPFSLEDMIDPLEKVDWMTRQVRDQLFYVHDRLEFYDTLPKSVSQAAEAAAINIAAKEAAKGGMPVKSPLTDTEEILENVNEQIGRLNAETAIVLSQTMKRLDKRQRHIEQRQEDMLAAIREMLHTLQMLQSEASSLTTQLRHNTFARAQGGPRSSNWRRGLAGTVVPACFDCTSDPASVQVAKGNNVMSLPIG